MVYKKSIPQPTDNLDDSQVDLLNNFTQLDDSFDVDHVAFSDTTADNGRHKTVTFVKQTAEPTTAADQVKGYTIEPIAATGPIQFSKGESDSVPTPVTGMHLSGLTTLATLSSVDVLDFSGLTRATCLASSVRNGDATGGRDSLYYVAFDGTNLRVAEAAKTPQESGSGSPIFRASGTTLQLYNSNSSVSVTNITWSLTFLRLE